MKKTIITTSLAFVSTAPLAHAQRLENPYFFEAQKKGQSILIFGSHHVGFTIDDLPAYVIEALKKQKVYMTESLKDDASVASAGPESDPKPFAPETIKQLGERGLSADWIGILQKMPGLACSVYESYEGIRDRLILDEELEQLATREGKKKVALDDPKLMAKINQKNAKECDINARVKEVSGAQSRAAYEQSLKDYRSGEMKHAEVDTLSDAHQVSARNADWVKKILATGKGKSVFVTVGYGHLGGKDGLLNLLKQKGFKVWRVRGDEKTEY